MDSNWPVVYGVIQVDCLASTIVLRIYMNILHDYLGEVCAVSGNTLNLRILTGCQGWQQSFGHLGVDKHLNLLKSIEH